MTVKTPKVCECGGLLLEGTKFPEGIKCLNHCRFPAERKARKTAKHRSFIDRLEAELA